MTNVLYIHGMGGGGDSRIPSILNDALNDKGIRIVVRTYDFDPESAHEQILSWVDELNPALVIGESLGSVHAIRIKGIPHVLISPSLNAPLFFWRLSWMAWIPGMTWLLDHIYRPREGDRQKLHFTFPVLRKYGAHRKLALENSTRSGSDDFFHAFFGTSRPQAVCPSHLAVNLRTFRMSPFRRSSRICSPPPLQVNGTARD